jgi:CHASE2 domain-containing sensor protein
MSIKKVFGLYKINKNILKYAIGVAICALGTGYIIGYTTFLYFRNSFFSTLLPIVLIVIGLITANIYYNRIIKK